MTSALDGDKRSVAVPGRFTVRGNTPTRNWVKGWRQEGATHGRSGKFVASGGKQTPEPDVWCPGI